MVPPIFAGILMAFAPRSRETGTDSNARGSFWVSVFFVAGIYPGA